MVISEVRKFQALTPDVHASYHDGDGTVSHPHSFVYAPIQQSLHQEEPRNVVATITAAIAWDASLRNLLPEEIRGLACVIHNNCNQSFTYVIDGAKAVYQGEGDSHDIKFDSLKKVVPLAWNEEEWFVDTPGHCVYAMVSFQYRFFRFACKTLVLMMMFCSHVPGYLSHGRL